MLRLPDLLKPLSGLFRGSDSHLRGKPRAAGEVFWLLDTERIEALGAAPACGVPNAFARVLPFGEGAAGQGLQLNLAGGMQIRGTDADNVELVGRLLAQR